MRWKFIPQTELASEGGSGGFGYNVPWISETWPADPTGGRAPAAVGIQESTASSPKTMVLLEKWFQNRDAGESRDPNGLYGP